ncbi:MAG: hypothetical protein JWQ04_2484, partial [Pedosphaera sp.]|nr:hypothetical protein [Pedosphaera sp.]
FNSETNQAIVIAACGIKIFVLGGGANGGVYHTQSGTSRELFSHGNLHRL